MLKQATRMPIAAALALISSVSTSQAAATPRLAGTVHVHARSPGWVAVEVPQPLPVTDGSDALLHAEIDGAGDLRALALRREVPARDGRYPTLTVKQYDGGSQTRSTHSTLPAGVYRLYLVAGDMASAELSTSLPGAADLQTTTPVPLVMAEEGEKVTFWSPSNPLGALAFAYFSDERPLEGLFRLEYWAEEPSEICSTVVAVDDWRRYDRGCPDGSPRVLLSRSEEVPVHTEGWSIGYGVNSGPDAFSPPYVEAKGTAFAFDDPPPPVAGRDPAPQAPSPAPPVGQWASLPYARAAVRGGAAGIAVRCLGAGGCRGRLVAGRHARPFWIASGRVGRVRIPVGRRTRRTAVTLIGRGADGGVITVERMIRLVRRR